MVGPHPPTVGHRAAEPFGFYEFFAGGGMARLGLGASWECLFANDFDAKKVAAYRRNFGGAPELIHSNVKDITAGQSVTSGKAGGLNSGTAQSD